MWNLLTGPRAWFTLRGLFLDDEPPPMPEVSPAFLLYARDFYTGTAELSCTEVGAYIRALCWSWDNGPLPTAFERRSRVCGCTPDEFRSIWPELEPLWEETEEGWINRRLEDVRAERREFHSKKSQAGIASGRARRTKAEQRSNSVQDSFEQERNERPTKREPSISTSSTEQDQELPAGAGTSFPQPVEKPAETIRDVLQELEADERTYRTQVPAALRGRQELPTERPFTDSEWSARIRHQLARLGFSQQPKSGELTKAMVQVERAHGRAYPVDRPSPVSVDSAQPVPSLSPAMSQWLRAAMTAMETGSPPPPLPSKSPKG